MNHATHTQAMEALIASGFGKAVETGGLESWVAVQKVRDLELWRDAVKLGTDVRAEHEDLAQLRAILAVLETAVRVKLALTQQRSREAAADAAEEKRYREILAEAWPARPDLSCSQGCGREGRLIVDGVRYCKRCADDLGLRSTGRIGAA